MFESMKTAGIMDDLRNISEIVMNLEMMARQLATKLEVLEQLSIIEEDEGENG